MFTLPIVQFLAAGTFTQNCGNYRCPKCYSGNREWTPGRPVECVGSPTCSRVPAVCAKAPQSSRRAAPAITLVMTSVPVARQQCVRTGDETTRLADAENKLVYEVTALPEKLTRTLECKEFTIHYCLPPRWKLGGVCVLICLK